MVLEERRIEWKEYGGIKKRERRKGDCRSGGGGLRMKLLGAPWATTRSGPTQSFFSPTTEGTPSANPKNRQELQLQRRARQLPS